MATQSVCPACGLSFEDGQDVVMIRDFETEEWAAGVRVRPDRGPGGGGDVYHQHCLLPSVTDPPKFTKYGAFENETKDGVVKTHACATSKHGWPVEDESLCTHVETPDDNARVERFNQRHELVDAVDCGICLRSLTKRL